MCLGAEKEPFIHDRDSQTMIACNIKIVIPIGYPSATLLLLSESGALRPQTEPQHRKLY
jgi:hypothetical protein